jgi:acetyl-CoA synthetase
MDALLPTLYFGFPIVGARGRFDPERAFELLQRYGVSNTFLFPTALKMMMKSVAAPRERYRLRLRAVMSAVSKQSARRCMTGAATRSASPSTRCSVRPR